EIDVQRFLRCVPDWEAHAEGLHAIVLGNSDDAMGEYDHRGIIHLHSWDADLFWECKRAFFEEHRETLRRIGVPDDEVAVAGAPILAEDGDPIVPLYFDERSARAFQLVHIFLHELGHHRDRMEKAGQWGRGEEFAESWAVRMEALV